MRVLVLKPEIDIPFKRPVLVTKQMRAVLGAGEVQELRRYWTMFADYATIAFNRAGHNAVVLKRPQWEFSTAIVNMYEPDLVLIPHKIAPQFPGLNCPAFFYMQMYFPHLFTCDRMGWGASSSKYPFEYGDGDATSSAFDDLAALAQGNVSKFPQPERGPIKGLPEKFIFLPCQLPHDETLQFHSDISMAGMIKAVTEWCTIHQVDVVLKEHPANPASMAQLHAVAMSSPHVHWANASVHDLIERCDSVWTVNSGVGFEAILQNKPVVTFGRAEYDCVTLHAEADTIGEAYATLDAGGHEVSPRRRRFYRKFVDLYVNSYGFDMNSTDIGKRFEALVADAESEIAAAA